MKLFILAIILVTSLVAKDFTSRYDVHIGMFGKIGHIDLIVKEDKTSYEIKVIAKTVGSVATLTKNREELFSSKGKIVDGKYIPDVFVKTRNTNSKNKTQTYVFNHETKEIVMTQNQSELVNSTRFDPMAFKIINKQNIEKSTKVVTLDTYTQNDVLSSYLNAKISCNANAKDYSLLAIGAKNDKNNVSLSFLDADDKASAISSFSNDTKDVYNLHVAPFDKDKEVVDILIAFDNDGHMKEAYLGDIFWVGEVRAVRIYTQVTSR